MNNLFAQDNNPYSKQWDEIDALFHTDRPQSAIKEAEKILASAKSKKDLGNMMKAHIFILNAAEMFSENAYEKKISEAKKQIAKTSGAERAIWLSVTANYYYKYYDQNRYKVLSRTAVEENPSEDFTTWDAAHFMKVISELYLEALQDEKELQKISISQIEPILTRKEGLGSMHPTLFEVIAFTALNFFENPGMAITKPEQPFELNDEKSFLSAHEFVKTQFSTSDKNAASYQAIKIYQKLLSGQINSKRTADDFFHTDLKRLEFVYKNSIAPNKEELYLEALEKLSKAASGNEQNARVLFAIANRLYTTNNIEIFKSYFQYQPNEEVKRQIPQIRKRITNIIAQYPDSYGATLAKGLLNSIDEQRVSIQVEDVSLPEQAIKSLIEYRNVKEVYWFVYKADLSYPKPDKWKETDYLNQLINEQQPVQKGKLSLKGVEDLEMHATEFKINPLPFGLYYIFVSTDEKPKVLDRELDVYTNFTVSNLSILTSGSTEMSSKSHILNRKSGEPKAKVQAELYNREYNSKLRQYEIVKKGTFYSDKYGEVKISGLKDSYYNQSLLLSEGEDTLIVNSFYQLRSTSSASKVVESTFLFTDRSIYRPGQTIYFKGIIVRKSVVAGDNNVVANRKTTVTFYDANRQKIASLDVTTNEYGSFSGTFTAPETGITGRMTISEKNGSKSVSVEEYKRPKFFVEFDKVKDAYSLNQKVKISGNAKAYAGNNIDGATVKYSIQRRARFPYYWVFLWRERPYSETQLIAHGVTQTDEHGKFDIEFEAIPDKSIDPNTLPVFTYEISVDITDQNGETRSETNSVSAAYRSLEIIAQVPQQGYVKDYDSITITTRNLNGVYATTSLSMKIHKLQFPGKIYRERLWRNPDKPLMSKQDFEQHFPDDEYENESDYRSWKVGKEVYSVTFKTTEKGKLNLPKNIWKEEGWYVLSWKGKDTNGKEIEEKIYTYVVLPNKKQVSEKAFVAQAEKKVYEPGENAKWWLNTGMKNPYIFASSSVKSIFDKNGEATYKITETDRGGVYFSWFYLYNNRVYKEQLTLAVPWTNKDLKIEWATHRDKLLPGENETWTINIKGDKKEKVAAEVLAGMYDASLDAFIHHNWYRNKLVSNKYFSYSWKVFGIESTSTDGRSIYPHRYDHKMLTYPLLSLNYGSSHLMYDEMVGSARTVMYKSAAPSPVMEENAMVDASAPDEKATQGGGDLPDEPEKETDAEEVEDDVQIRKNLQETAFFFPDLRTNENGDVSFSFTMPEALTEWKLLTFAHTKDWQTGVMSGKVKTQKDLMVQPNLPRFLRQGDTLTLSTKIVNLSEQLLNGTATLEIINALTLQTMNLPFRLADNKKDFSVDKGRSTTVNWEIFVPIAVYQPVIIRIVAKAGSFSDGEENTLSVLSNRMMVTETMPLPVKGTGEHHFKFENLLKSNQGEDAKSLLNFNYTVEFTGNPAWYAVQALPYLMEYPFECSEQIFSRYYAHALAQHIVQQSPKIEKIFREWENNDKDALLSNLEKNQELKTALLEETPWVLDAQNESEQKRRIALLFESHKMAKGLSQNLNKLQKMQLPNGAFPWFVGMYENRYITQYIATGLGRMKHLGIKNVNNKTVNGILKNALLYLDEQIQDDYDALINLKLDLNKQQIGYTQIQYLYLRSFHLKDYPLSAKHQKAFDYYKNQAVKYWMNFNPYSKAMLAMSLNRLSEQKTAQSIIAGLKETAVRNDELGMYWKGEQRAYYWYQAPIETQAMLIAAFNEVGNNANDIADMKTWLLKNKQTSNWKSTTATADAIYALLQTGGDWLAYEPNAVIQLGAQTLDLSKEKTQAGTGYFKKNFQGSDITPEMGNISITINNPNQQEDIPVSWGAVYWQYFQDMDKIKAAETPLKIEKELFIQENTASGPKLRKITDGNKLKVGSKVKVRIILKTDRDMDYVHLKDMRAAAFEPTDVLSGYRYQDGLGYYMSTLDVSTNFFFDRLRKGTYVLEYQVFVGQKGKFSNGISTVQCMYAPEFSSHSEGIKVEVE